MSLLDGELAPTILSPEGASSVKSFTQEQGLLQLLLAGGLKRRLIGPTRDPQLALRNR